MKKISFVLLMSLIGLFACQPESEKVGNKGLVIAHRGSTFWTPEETEPAYRWARNIGADYLEFDIQLTKDSVLVAFHDSNLSRTSNIAEVFPDRIKSVINDFTLKELRSLDVGSWFNSAHPERAKDGFKNLKILTLEDVVMIAEGYRIKRNDAKPELEIIDGQWTGRYLYEKDPDDNGNRPGIYIETKNPKLNVERILAEKIKELGWNIKDGTKEIKTQDGKVDVANTDSRIILQSFSRTSIQQLELYMPEIPKCLLLSYSRMKDDIPANYKEAISFAVAHNVTFLGPSISNEPNVKRELIAPWMAELIHGSGLQIHPYTFNTEKQLNEYSDRIDGVFTNRADLALEFYNRKNENTAQECLLNLGY